MAANPWLARLKGPQPPTEAPAKPTKPGSVGSAGPDTGAAPEIQAANLPAANDGQPDPERWSWPTGTAMAEPEIEAFQARLHLFTEQGLALHEAEAMADKLTQRDRDGDDRRICLECSYLGEQGHCIAAATGRLPGASARLEPVQTILQRCEGFGLRKGLA